MKLHNNWKRRANGKFYAQLCVRTLPAVIGGKPYCSINIIKLITERTLCNSIQDDEKEMKKHSRETATKHFTVIIRGCRILVGDQMVTWSHKSNKKLRRNVERQSFENFMLFNIRPWLVCVGLHFSGGLGEFVRGFICDELVVQAFMGEKCTKTF